MSNSKTKKHLRETMEKVKTMLEERQEFLKEIEDSKKLKQEYDKIADDDSESPMQGRETNVSTASQTTVSETPPGRRVFEENRKYQNFTFSNLIPNPDDLRSPLSSSRMKLRLKILPLTPSSKKIMKQLFYLMSMDEDCVVTESCYHYLSAHIDSWIPKISHIVNIFTNWGATYESLGMTDFDISLVYPFNIPSKNSNQIVILPTFCHFHYHHVFAFIKLVIQKCASSDMFSEMEILLLLKIFLKISLDQRFPLIINSIKRLRLINVCIDSIAHWNDEKVADITKKYIYDKNECYHNLVAMATTILPRISRCNELRSCLAFAVLQLMILQEEYFGYPHEDNELLDLARHIKCETASLEELAHLNLIISLVHSCIHASDMFKGESIEIVRGIQDCLEKVKMDLSRESGNYHADLLARRITYCETMWNLFSDQKF